MMNSEDKMMLPSGMNDMITDAFDVTDNTLTQENDDVVSDVNVKPIIGTDNALNGFVDSENNNQDKVEAQAMLSPVEIGEFNQENMLNNALGGDNQSVDTAAEKKSVVAVSSHPSFDFLSDEHHLEMPTISNDMVSEAEPVSSLQMVGKWLGETVDYENYWEGIQRVGAESAAYVWALKQGNMGEFNGKLFVKEMAKAGARSFSTEGLRTAGNLLDMVGVNFKNVNPEESSSPVLSSLLPKVGNVLSDIGNAFKNYAEKTEQAEWLAPSEEVYDEDPNWIKLANVIGQGSAQVAAMGVMSKFVGTGATYALFSGGGAAEVFHESYEKDKDVSKANTLAALNASTTFAIDKIFNPLPKTIEKNAKITAKLIAKEMVGAPLREAGSEVLQQMLAENLVRKVGIDDTQDLFEGLLESAIGAMAGSATVIGTDGALYYPRKNLEQITKKILKKVKHKKEVDDCVNGMLDYMMNKPQAFDKILQISVDKNIEEMENYADTAEKIAEMEGVKTQEKEFQKIHELVYQKALKETGDEGTANVFAGLMEADARILHKLGSKETAEEFLQNQVPEIKQTMLKDFVQDGVAYGAPVSFSLGGLKAKKADWDQYWRAKKLEDMGYDNHFIWASTGWYKGQDGQMRFSIDDSEARVKFAADIPELELPRQYWTTYINRLRVMETEEARNLAIVERDKYGKNPHREDMGEEFYLDFIRYLDENYERSFVTGQSVTGHFVFHDTEEDVAKKIAQRHARADYKLDNLALTYHERVEKEKVKNEVENRKGVYVPEGDNAQAILKVINDGRVEVGAHKVFNADTLFSLADNGVVPSDYTWVEVKEQDFNQQMKTAKVSGMLKDLLYSYRNKKIYNEYLGEDISISGASLKKFFILSDNRSKRLLIPYLPYLLAKAEFTVKEGTYDKNEKVNVEGYYKAFIPVKINGREKYFRLGVRKDNRGYVFKDLAIESLSADEQARLDAGVPFEEIYNEKLNAIIASKKREAELNEMDTADGEQKVTSGANKSNSQYGGIPGGVEVASKASLTTSEVGGVARGDEVTSGSSKTTSQKGRVAGDNKIISNAGHSTSHYGSIPGGVEVASKAILTTSQNGRGAGDNKIISNANHSISHYGGVARGDEVTSGASKTNSKHGSIPGGVENASKASLTTSQNGRGAGDNKIISNANHSISHYGGVARGDEVTSGASKTTSQNGRVAGDNKIISNAGHSTSHYGSIPGGDEVASKASLTTSQYGGVARGDEVTSGASKSTSQKWYSTFHNGSSPRGEMRGKEPLLDININKENDIVNRKITNNTNNSLYNKLINNAQQNDEMFVRVHPANQYKHTVDELYTPTELKAIQALFERTKYSQFVERYHPEEGPLAETKKLVALDIKKYGYSTSPSQSLTNVMRGEEKIRNDYEKRRSALFNLGLPVTDKISADLDINRLYFSYLLGQDDDHLIVDMNYLPPFYRQAYAPVMLHEKFLSLPRYAYLSVDEKNMALLGLESVYRLYRIHQERKFAEKALERDLRAANAYIAENYANGNESLRQYWQQRLFLLEHKNFKLSELLEHTKLYDNYPEIADAEVHFVALENNDGYHFYHDKERNIDVLEIDPEALNYRRLKDILLRGANFAAQMKENFDLSLNETQRRNFMDGQVYLAKASIAPDVSYQVKEFVKAFLPEYKGSEFLENRQLPISLLNIYSSQAKGREPEFMAKNAKYYEIDYDKMEKALNEKYDFAKLEPVDIPVRNLAFRNFQQLKRFENSRVLQIARMNSGYWGPQYPWGGITAQGEVDIRAILRRQDYAEWQRHFPYWEGDARPPVRHQSSISEEHSGIDAELNNADAKVLHQPEYMINAPEDMDAYPTAGTDYSVKSLGAYHFTKNVIYLFENSGPKELVHETFHAFRRMLENSNLKDNPFVRDILTKSQQFYLEQAYLKYDVVRYNDKYVLKRVPREDKDNPYAQDNIPMLFGSPEVAIEYAAEEVFVEHFMLALDNPKKVFSDKKEERLLHDIYVYWLKGYFDEYSKNDKKTGKGFAKLGEYMKRVFASVEKSIVSKRKKL